MNVKKTLFACMFLAFFSAVTTPFTLAKGDAVCMVYFTRIGCQNCEVTDPVILGELPGTCQDTVVIEYETFVNSRYNSLPRQDYVINYNLYPGVPEVLFGTGNVLSGRIDVLEAEDKVRELEANPCPLPDGSSVPFNDLDLTSLPGRPNVFRGGRVLMSGVGGDNQLLKKLLIAENITLALAGAEFETIEPVSVQLSGGRLDFEHAIRMGNWTFQWDGPPLGLNGREADNRTCEPEDKGPEGVIGLPLFGSIDTEKMALPVLTVTIGLADGFNPCAFFVLFFLLSLLVYAGPRRRMLLIGGVFVFFSGLIYFLFMSAWMNFFLIIGYTEVVAVIAGLAALAIAAVNIKDFFFFKRGVSLTISESAKPRLFTRMRCLLKAESLTSMLAGTVVLAVTVNLYELLCTMGFPMVYTRILTLYSLPALQYYLYLVLYNVAYILPLMAIVMFFTATLGSRKLSPWGGRSLKLVSGMMMLCLGLVLVFNPMLLENVVTSVLILGLAVCSAITIIFIKAKLRGSKKGDA